MRNAPSMTGLRAFEAVVRQGTLSGAARELCVTPAAVSHRLRELERICGQPMLVRRSGRFVVTAFGQKIVEALGDAFTRIREADSLLNGNTAPVIHLTAPYSFASLWLAQHLPDFEARHPDVDLRIFPSHEPLKQTPADIVIVHSDTCPGSHWTLLFRDVCAVMGRPDHPLIQSQAGDLNDVLKEALLHVGVEHGSAHGAFTWARWSEIKGLCTPLPATGGTYVTAEHLAVDSLRRKKSLGLISLINAADHLERGELATISGSQALSDCSYWISVHDRPGSASRAVALLHAWLVDSLAAQCLYITGVDGQRANL